MTDLDVIRETITRETGQEPVGTPRALGGGCINEAFRLGEYFIKSNTPPRLDMFEMELQGLTTLHDTATVKVPRPICSGVTRDRSFLVLEFLALGDSDSRAQELLGRQLADLHRTTTDHFGWSRDNYIGTTSQPNTPSSSWVDFLRESRLGHMLRLAGAHGFSFRGADTLLDNLDCFFEEPPPPSLLHGDLWGGNAGVLTDGVPVIFDPAVYYGDREADLAMTHLFGGFNSSFYRAYQEAWPLPPGHELRTNLYNLYHILNHSILFGGSYAPQAQSMIDTLLRSL
ncbi:MAG: fructosamine kinase family protein [Verrucomicrobiota bacterium]|nr:fructosamine kinase family protein [Verrucomicrobiota bacterium]